MTLMVLGESNYEFLSPPMALIKAKVFSIFSNICLVSNLCLDSNSYLNLICIRDLCSVDFPLP